MPGVMDNLSKINSFIRTLLASIVVGVIGVGSYFGYQTYNAKELTAKALIEVQENLEKAQAEVKAKLAIIVEKEQEITKLNADIDRLQTAMRLLKVDKRLAQITVKEQAEDPVSKELYTVIDFVELNNDGKPLGAGREFKIRGDIVFVDCWTVKFDDSYVEKNDLQRGTSLCLFRRIFGERQQPLDGFSLDEIGMRPQAYARGGQLTDFEKKIWGDFWSIANDKEKSAAMGIRANNGEAVSMKMQSGKKYTLQLRASDGLSIVNE